MSRPSQPGDRIVRIYAATTGLFTLAASLIWAVNTIFLIRRGGLSIFEVLLVNTAFSLGQLVFEVPTGVIADTIGRRTSYLLSIGTLVISTLLYVAVPIFGWGFWGFAFASLLLGLGFTFQSGAVDAWMVDALDDAGWTGAKDRAFAAGQIAFSSATLIGSLLGGVLGQIDLLIPYVARAAILLAAFAVVWLLVRDRGFVPRRLRWSSFGEETRAIFSAGVKYGWRSRVVRPLLFVGLLSGVFSLFSFYSWQPYLLELIGRNYVWLLGVVQAGSSLAMIGGNLLVRRMAARRPGSAGQARTLAVASVAGMVIAAGIGLVGIVSGHAGVGPAAVAIVLWLVWGVIYGLMLPMQSALINQHIPSAERATVLSLQSLFMDAGGSVGQPALGYLAERVSISAGWVVGALFVGAGAPLYRQVVKAVRGESEDPAI